MLKNLGRYKYVTQTKKVSSDLGIMYGELKNGTLKWEGESILRLYKKTPRGLKRAHCAKMPRIEAFFCHYCIATNESAV